LGDHLLLVRSFELGSSASFNATRLGGDDVHQGTCLQAGEHGGVDRLLMFGLHQDEPAAGAAQGLVRGAGDEVAIPSGLGYSPAAISPA